MHPQVRERERERGRVGWCFIRSCSLVVVVVVVAPFCLRSSSCWWLSVGGSFVWVSCRSLGVSKACYSQTSSASNSLQMFRHKVCIEAQFGRCHNRCSRGATDYDVTTVTATDYWAVVQPMQSILGGWVVVVSNLTTRLFGVWTAVSTAVRLQCSYNITNWVCMQ
jgi:hypothetical protein